jgi:cyclopropane fatty-acyl-phospholipid synthase-like methyltransferase
MRRKHRARHSKSRDCDSIPYHYDVGNDFFRLFLGPSMVYSCGYWDDGTDPVDVARRNKCDLFYRKLGLEPGMRLLVVGCGWAWVSTSVVSEGYCALKSARWISSPVFRPARVVAWPVSSRMGVLFAQSVSACGS